jgi:hypothetical protein
MGLLVKLEEALQGEWGWHLRRQRTGINEVDITAHP